jgi:peptidyl-prolyl cis-trans isomerase D
MLDTLRERAGRWVIGVILGLLVLSFSLWGIGSYFQPRANAAVARVGDSEIGLQDLQRAIERQSARYRELLGDAYRPGMIEPDVLREQALRAEIERRLLHADAQRRHLTVADATLAGIIRASDAFQGAQGFDPQRYRAALQARGISAAGFEQQMRGDVVIQQLDRGLVQSALVTPGEAEALARIWFETRDLVVATLAREQFSSAEAPTDAQVQAYYEARREEFRTPERVRAAYLLLDPAAVADEVSVEPAEIEARYREQEERYRIPERRTVRHILIAVAKDAPVATIEEARQRAQALAREIEGGADFAALARAHSQDPGSAKQGGLLGTYARGMLDAPVDTAAFSLDAGAVSAPVRSDYGWHLVRVDAITPEQVTPLDEARAQIEPELRRSKADALVRTRAEDLGRLAFEHPDTLEPAAQATGLDIRRADFFPRGGGAGIAAEPAFNEAAFADAARTQGLNSELIELDGGRYAVLRVEETEPAAALPLEEVRADIEERLRREAAARAAREAGERMLAALRAGTPREALPGAPAPAWTALADVPREGRAGVPEAVVEQAFRLARPQEGAATYGGVGLAGGDYVLVGVTGTATDPRADDPAERARLREAVQGVRREAALAAYLEALRSEIPVRVFARND